MDITAQLHGMATELQEFPWNMRLNGLQSLSGSFGEDEISCPC